MIWCVRRHDEVERDLVAIAKWIARDSRDAAVRFLAAAEDTLRGLRHMPERGSLKGWRGKRLTGVRTWATRGFRNHLVVYEVRPDAVYVFAVVHGSRAYQRLVRNRLKWAGPPFTTPPS